MPLLMQSNFSKFINWQQLDVMNQGGLEADNGIVICIPLSTGGPIRI